MAKILVDGELNKKLVNKLMKSVVNRFSSGIIFSNFRKILKFTPVLGDVRTMVKTAVNNIESRKSEKMDSVKSLDLDESPVDFDFVSQEFSIEDILGAWDEYSSKMQLFGGIGFPNSDSFSELRSINEFLVKLNNFIESEISLLPAFSKNGIIVMANCKINGNSDIMDAKMLHIHVDLVFSIWGGNSE